MKRIPYILTLLTTASALLLSSCAKEKTVGSGANRSVNFSVAVSGEASAMDSDNATKGAMLNSGSTVDKISVTAWNNSESDHSSFISGYTDFSLTNGSITTDLPWTQPYEKIFYAYANAPESGATISSSTYEGQTLTYTVPSDAKDQNDILMGVYEGDGAPNCTATFILKHALTSVVFKVGSIDNVKSIDKISIENIYASGSVTQGPDGTIGDWTGTSSTQTTTQTISATLPEMGSAVGIPFILIPQTETEGLSIKLELTMADDTKKTCTGTLGATKDGIDWEAGKSNVYTISYSQGGTLAFQMEVEDWGDGGNKDLSFAESNSSDYLCFSAPTEHTIYLCRINDSHCEFEYSYDGVSWETYEFSDTPLSPEPIRTYFGDFYIYSGPPCIVNSGTKVYFRGNKETNGNGLGHISIDYEEMLAITNDACAFLFDLNQRAADDLSVEGNILSLLDKNLETDINTTYDRLDNIPTAFPGLFFGLMGSPLADASRLELPSMSLGTGSYMGMFYNCSSLLNAPALPAQNLSNLCYNYMFNGCSSLESAPDLLATTLRPLCYAGMFKGCESLSRIKMLATEFDSGFTCVSNMLNGVSDSGTLTVDSQVLNEFSAVQIRYLLNLNEEWDIQGE